MTPSGSRAGQPKPLDAGGLQPEVSSFRLYLAAEGKAAKTVRTYTEAVQWFAAACLLLKAGRAGWEEVTRQDVQRWIAWLLGMYSVDRRAPGHRGSAVGAGRDPLRPRGPAAQRS